MPMSISAIYSKETLFEVEVGFRNVLSTLNTVVLFQNKHFNPSFTSPFGTHIFYQGGSSRHTPPPAISKTVGPMNVKFCRILETPLKVLEMLKLFT